MGNSRIHYVAGGELAVCGLPWRNKRRTRAPERATCEGCLEKVAPRAAAEGVPSELRKRYEEAELAGIVLVKALWQAREQAERLGRWAEAARLRQLEGRAVALRQELGEAPVVPRDAGVQEALRGVCPVCVHPRHEPGRCGAPAGSLLSLAPRPCPCAAHEAGPSRQGSRRAA